MDPDSRVHRVGLLVEEWKVLATYIADGFSTLEKLSGFIVIIVGVAAGVGAATDVRPPPEVWLFAGPAVLTLLFRMLAQLSFSFFQANRLMDVEDQIQRLMKNDADADAGLYFRYGHKLHELAEQLRRDDAYAYRWWIKLVNVLGLAMILYAMGNACIQLWEWTWPWLAEWCRPYLGKILSVLYAVAMLTFIAIWLKCTRTLNQQFQRFRDMLSWSSGTEDPEAGISESGP